MLVSGKSSPNAWLSLPISALPTWARLNGIELDGIEISENITVSAQAEEDTGGTSRAADLIAPIIASKGSGLVATTALDGSRSTPILTVPFDLVLSENRVRQLASGDARLADLLEACAALATSPRITILVFLLYQATIANPDVLGRFGQHTAFLEYFKFLQIPRASTLYTEEEISLFDGTTLVPATQAKLRKLYREFAALREKTSSLSWIRSTWWSSIDEESDMVTIDDWIILDAIYRSRALEWPGQGEALVPVLDLANHAIPSNATFDVSSKDEGVLLLVDNTHLTASEEVLISYGDHKTPLEIFFSYGFLPDYTDRARAVLLTLPPLDVNDPLTPPKAAMAAKENAVPGIRVYEHEDTIAWSSELLWLVIANEEDGLGFKVAYGSNGERELDIFWHDEKVSVMQLETVLKQDRLYDLLRLRATVIVLQQVARQLQEFNETSLDFESGAAADDADPLLVDAARRLRRMEEELLIAAGDTLERQKDDLVKSPIVQEYFTSMRGEVEMPPLEDIGDSIEDDFT